MVVGPAGVGKSSFIEIFLRKFNYDAFKRVYGTLDGHETGVNKLDGDCHLYGNDVIRNETNGFVDLSISSSHAGSKRFTVTMVDSPGYGHKMDAETWRQYITDELERRNIVRSEK